MPNFKNVLFDLDGTLTDSKEGILNSILYSLDKLQVQEPNIHELESFIGPPIREAFKSRYNFSDDIADKAVMHYREYFSVKGMYENRVYSGVPELLKSLHALKINLFVATSKRVDFAKKILEHFQLNIYFTSIEGVNPENPNVEKNEIISNVLNAYGLKRNETVMIGDRKYDIIGAKKNNIKSIAIGYGYGTFVELNQHNPDYFVANVEQLKSMLTGVR